MELSTMSWVLTGIVTVLGALVSGLFWRQLAKSDEEAKAWKESIDQAFKEHREREAAFLADLNALKLEMASKIGRDELDKLYKKIDDLSAAVITALGHKGGA